MGNGNDNGNNNDWMKRPLTKEEEMIMLKYKLSLAKQMNLADKVREYENLIYIRENHLDEFIDEEMKKYR